MMSSMLFDVMKWGEIQINTPVYNWFASRSAGRTPVSAVEQLPGPGGGRELRGEWMESQREMTFLNICLFRAF